MGLTVDSVGAKAAESEFEIKKENESDKVIALAGNPNVGKSSVFNALTGLRQHTGNWAGKTVSNAHGKLVFEDKNYILVDIPGTYSLMAHSREEEVARDFICFGDYDGVIVVCDATCLERNMNLVLQTIEITDKVVVCINLMDEAKKKGIHIDAKKISERLGVPVVLTSARKKKGLDKLMSKVSRLLENENLKRTVKIKYLNYIESAVAEIAPLICEAASGSRLKPEWIALKLLEGDEKLICSISAHIGYNLMADEQISAKIQAFYKNGVSKDKLEENVASCIVMNAQYICEDAVVFQKENYNSADRKIDKILTSRWGGIPVMIALLGLVFWLTVSGANVLSEILSGFMSFAEGKLLWLFTSINVPQVICDILIFGVFRVTGWVVSVMLPPMAIFFPLFTLLEDLGYLPRVAFNLDKSFKKCGACGKQALTMCMGFGCNAAGIVGCRIIDSPRERLIAMLTNSFVPCNGKFPTLIAIITMFFTFSVTEPIKSVAGALLLTGVVVLGIFVTFLASAFLSKTVLKGEASSFTLELPPYRKPQIGSIIVRSVFDRTLFVLGRAIAVAAPAGAIIWILANVSVGEVTLLKYMSDFLDPFARIIGMDGVILLAFILGWPANELVVPLIIMMYTSSGALSDQAGFEQMKQLFLANGWTWITAVNVMLFSLMHWPCSTSTLTVKKETGSGKWTAAAVILPTAAGVIICAVFTFIARLFV